MNRGGLVGLGVGITAAGLATAAGVAADRLSRSRGTAVALGRTGSYEEHADEELVVVAPDGVPLHVEVDHPVGPPRPEPGAAAPTIVFTHGYTLDLRSWVFQRRALRAAGYRVVLWDQRGHGRSGAGSREANDIDQLGRDLALVIDRAVPKGPIVLVGHSMGGMTMMALAVEHPELLRERVVGAAFISTSPGGLSGVSWGLGNALGRLVHRVGPVAVGRLAGRQGLVDSARRAGRSVEEYFVDRYSFASPVPLSVVRLAADMIFGTTMEVMSDFMPTFDRHDKREALARFVGIETLVLNGMQDLLTPPEHSEEIVRLVPGAEHVLVRDAGHIIMLEHPDVVSDQLRALVERGMRAATAHEGRSGKGKGKGEGAPAPERRPRVRHTVTDLAHQRTVDAARRRRRHVS